MKARKAKRAKIATVRQIAEIAFKPVPEFREANKERGERQLATLNHFRTSALIAIQMMAKTKSETVDMARKIDGDLANETLKNLQDAQESGMAFVELMRSAEIRLMSAFCVLQQEEDHPVAA